MVEVTEEVTIRLNKPITRRSAATGQVIEIIPEVTIRRPLMGDLVQAMSKAGGGSDAGAMTLHLTAILSGLPVRDIEGLELDDGMRLFAQVMDFMPAGLPTSANGSPSSPANSASPPTGGSGGLPN